MRWINFRLSKCHLSDQFSVVKTSKDKAKGIVAHRLGRTVYYMLKNQQVFDIKKFVNQEQDRPGQGTRVTLQSCFLLSRSCRSDPRQRWACSAIRTPAEDGSEDQPRKT
jgi:hypothetical protein